MNKASIGYYQNGKVNRRSERCSSLRRALHTAIHGTVFSAVYGVNRGTTGSRDSSVVHVVAMVALGLRMPGSGGLHVLTMALHRLHGFHVRRPKGGRYGKQQPHHRQDGANPPHTQSRIYLCILPGSNENPLNG